MFGKILEKESLDSKKRPNSVKNMVTLRNKRTISRNVYTEQTKTLLEQMSRIQVKSFFSNQELTKHKNFGKVPE